MLKVLKFGGSSLADAHQFAKVKSIVDADPARRVVIVSAPGKRFSGDTRSPICSISAPHTLSMAFRARISSP